MLALGRNRPELRDSESKSTAATNFSEDALMKLLVLTVCAGVLVAPSTLAQTLQIRGVAGYRSEYELTADVSGQSADQGWKELSGPLSVKHVGLCTHAGPGEMLGRLKIQFMDASHKIEASLSYDGRECAYYGFLSETATGFMTCNNKLTLPLRLWTK
jgi:hypothetical protein